MKEQLITFETAKLAKEKGFANKTPHRLRRNYYNSYGGLNGNVTEYIKAKVNNKDTEPFETIDAPTQSLLQKWLREEHRIIVEVKMFGSQAWDVEIVNYKITRSRDYFKTYEEALEKGLIEALKLI